METKEREAHRTKSRHYGVEGNCHKRSGVKPLMKIGSSPMPIMQWVDISCTPDCDCTRMRRYDKRKKQEQI